MKNIDELSSEELHVRILNATAELMVREAAKKVAPVPQTVDEPETIEHEGLKLVKVDRKARVGDYIRPTETIKSKLTNGSLYGPVINYESEWISGLVVNHNGRPLMVYADYHKRTIKTVDVFEVVEESLQDEQIVKSPNQQREKTIQSAKEFYAANSGDSFFWEHDKEKREVSVCKITLSEFSKEVTELTVRCNEGIVFNLDIYKAVAIATVLEIEIPDEFLNAVQPTELVVGMEVERFRNTGDRIGSLEIYSVSETEGNRFHTHLLNHNYGYNEKDGDKIIDDTNAEYGNHDET